VSLTYYVVVFIVLALLDIVFSIAYWFNLRRAPEAYKFLVYVAIDFLSILLYSIWLGTVGTQSWNIEKKIYVLCGFYATELLIELLLDFAYKKRYFVASTATEVPKPNL
jgi:hypothetical protein